MRFTLALTCMFALSLVAIASAISPRFDARGYTVVSDTPILRSQFNNWARDSGRSYSSQEFNYRYNVWRDNLAFIEHFNANANASFTLGINEFGDMTEDEAVRLQAGLMVPHAARATLQGDKLEAAEAEAQREIVERQVPSSYDWRSAGAVGPIKNQGSCGACYAFTANAAIEGMHKIATGQLPVLSEQMLLDCAQGTGNLGCAGGNMEVTYSWILNNGGGVNTQASYPYTGARGSCRYRAQNNAAYIKSFRRAPAGSESGLLALAANGPVSVGINASPRSFLYYRSGTLSDASCTSTGLNHAVTVVGWGTDASGRPYWLIKNSWGTSWGQNGYGMIARDSGNMCGIASMASQPCYSANCA